jgi:hypothetical protein
MVNFGSKHNCLVEKEEKGRCKMFFIAIGFDYPEESELQEFTAVKMAPHPEGVFTEIT